MMITPAQLRAARGLLDWTRSDLAKAAGLSPETIKNIEHGKFHPQEQTSQSIITAFKGHDIEFTENEGVLRRKSSIIMYEGREGFRKFMDDVYQEASRPESADKTICVSNVDDRKFLMNLGDYAQTHIKRMNDIKKIKIKVLVNLQDFFMAPGADYIEYRGYPLSTAASVPFYVYGDKLAIIMFQESDGPQVAVVKSPLVANAYREQFEILWNSAKTANAGAH